MVLAVCRRLLGDAHEAEDVFQATFLVLAQKAKAVGRPELVGPWLHGVATRIAGRARQAARRRARQREAVHMPSSDPALDAAQRDLSEVLDGELARLADKYRRPLVLVYLQGQSTEEAARILGCPKGTVLSRLARGRDALRARLIRRGTVVAPAVLLLVLEQNSSPAGVPAIWAERTLAAAARGATPSPAVSLLTQGELRSMFLNKLKLPALILVLLAVSGAGTVIGVRHAVADKPAVGEKDKPASDEEKIAGAWAITAMEEGGQKAPEDSLKDAKAILTRDGNMTLKRGEQDEERTFTLDPSRNPKEISQTNAKGLTLRGIYKLDGDTLTVCMDRNGNVPTEFASKEGTTVVLVVLKRQK
jgi:RNA polymerase sigma-70 factor (ECF subfamily)